jgi:hypothetical protein
MFVGGMLMSRRAFAAAFAALLLSAPAEAGPNDATIREIVERGAAQWSLFLSCSVLEPSLHENVLRWWTTEREELDAVLPRAGLAAEVAAAIAAAVDLAALMAPTRGDTAALIAFCNADPDWYRNLTIGRGILHPADEIVALIGR